MKQASDELEYAMYAYAIDELKKHGFTQYEIANFAKAGARSKHNQVYWRDENFHGIGCGASGKEDWGRYDNTRSLQEYLERGPCAQEIALDAQEQMFEALMMGLRLREGISLQQFEARFHARIEERFPTAMAQHLGKDLFIEEGYLRVSEEGKFVLNDILVDFL